MKKTKITDYHPDVDNPNQGTDRGAAAVLHSLHTLGAGRSIVVDRDGNVINGNKTQQAAVDAGLLDAIEIETDGNAIIVVRRKDLHLYDEDDPRARQLSYADNQTAALGLEWDAYVFYEDIEKGVDLTSYFTDDELNDVISTILDDEDLVEEVKPKQDRTIPIDAIWTLGNSIGFLCCIGVDAGFMYGVQSNASVAKGKGVCPCLPYRKAHKLEFIDNEWRGYDHDIHRAAVELYEPKYCTTRDALTRAQASEAGVKYMELEEILDQAEELRQWAQNVIVIPKYEAAIDKIPEHFMLGYSVPTSHGGTTIPIDAFKGRRVHLLGGSWTKQRKYLLEYGDMIVSFDNNYENLVAKYGNYALPNGKYRNIDDDIPHARTNHMAVCLVLGLGHIAAELRTMYNGEREVP